MLPPKTSHRTKFHRDRSNQLGDRGWSEKKFPHTDRLTHTRHPDWLSRASQHARGATKNLLTDALQIFTKVALIVNPTKTEMYIFLLNCYIVNFTMANKIWNMKWNVFADFLKAPRITERQNTEILKNIEVRHNVLPLYNTIWNRQVKIIVLMNG